jgi:hypothetical protein
MGDGRRFLVVRKMAEVIRKVVLLPVAIMHIVLLNPATN